MKRAVLIANGPSLAAVPNEWLDKYPTFGSNRVWLKYNPDVLALVDIKMVHNEQLQLEAVESFKSPKTKQVFLSKDAWEHLKPHYKRKPAKINVMDWWNYTNEDGSLQLLFAYENQGSLVSGGSITYGLLQIAWWQGFREILIVGLNQTFRDPRGDHFDPRYNREVGIPYERENVDNTGRGKGKWYWSEDKFVAKTNAFYTVARKFYEDNGGRIINCTPDTKCEVFPIDDWRSY